MEQVKRDDKGRFLPGETGNPQGRPPKAQTVTECLRQRIPADVLADMIAEKVKAGNDTFIKTVLEYYDGKPINKILEGKLDIVESEEWEELIGGLWEIAKDIPELKPRFYELCRKLDTTGRSSSLCETDIGEDAGRRVEGTGQSTGGDTTVEGETDSVSIPQAMGEVMDDSVQSPTSSEILEESEDTNSVPDPGTE